MKVLSGYRGTEGEEFIEFLPVCRAWRISGDRTAITDASLHSAVSQAVCGSLIVFESRSRALGQKRPNRTMWAVHRLVLPRCLLSPEVMAKDGS